MGASGGQMDARGWLLLLALSALWGGTFFLIAVALKDLPPLTLVLLRLGLAAVILVPLMRLSGLAFPRTLRGWMPFWAMSLFNNVLPFSMIAIGQTYVASGLAAILNATTPMFTVLVMAASGEERADLRRLAGVMTGLIGVVVLRSGDSISGQGMGVLLCLAAALSYGISAVVARRHLTASPPLVTATCQMIASTVMMALVAGVVDRPWHLPMPGLTTWAAVVVLATVSTALAYLVFFEIIRHSGPSNVMLVTLIIPVIAIALGSAVLGERVTPEELVGAAIIGIALLVIDGRVLRRRS